MIGGWNGRNDQRKSGCCDVQQGIVINYYFRFVRAEAVPNK